MSIKVLYFASLREQIGRASDAIELADLNKTGVTAIDAWKQATGQEDLSDDLLIAVNQEYTSADSLLEDGDEVAFFPPVTGG